MAAKHNVNNIPDQNSHDRGIIIISSEYYALDTRETEYIAGLHISVHLL